jgi:hypothetical protein
MLVINPRPVMKTLGMRLVAASEGRPRAVNPSGNGSVYGPKNGGLKPPWKMGESKEPVPQPFIAARIGVATGAISDRVLIGVPRATPTPLIGTGAFTASTKPKVRVISSTMTAFS